MTAPEETTSALVLRLFGPFEARLHGAPLARRRSRKGEWLLALLVLRHGRPVEREWLAGMLWPESSTSRALALMRRELTDLRRALDSEANRLHAPTSHTLSLDLTGADADVVAFDQAVAQGDLTSLEGAVALYRGPLLEGCTEEWIFQERQAREEAYLGAVESLAARGQQEGDRAAAERYLQRVIAIDPLREGARRRLMQVLAAGGNYAAMLETYRELRLRLHRELNAEPDPETRQLFETLRAAARRKAEGGRGDGGSGRQGGHEQNIDPAGSPRLPLPSSPPRPTTLRLPVQWTSFVGREREMAEVKRLLAGTHLLTLTGAGGTGKTRLALQVAAERLAEYRDGVWLVELASVSDPGLVPATVAGALRVREEVARPLTQILIDSLYPKHLLLLLDNCEHLIAACAQFADTVLRACPGLRMLATSREPLGAAGEQVYRVPSLSLPPMVDGSWLAADGPTRTDLSSPSTLMRSEAVRLFVDRAAAAAPDFALHARNVTAVAQICSRLDGVPLAIELAAARVRALSPEQIATRLDDRFRLLTGGSRTAPARQRTLQALIDWSYDLLSEPERALLRRLSAFAGGWTLEAAEVVCSDFGFRAGARSAGPVPGSGRLDFGLPSKPKPSENHTDLSDPIQNPNAQRAPEIQNDEVLDLLTRLVDRSLVVYEQPCSDASWARAEPRYRLLETVRQYSSERLREAGEEERARARHLDFYLRRVEAAEPESRGPEQRDWLACLTGEEDNLRAALDWSRANPRRAEAGLRLAAALGIFWMVRGSFTEGRGWLAELLDKRAEASAAVRARALIWGAVLAFFQADYAVTRSLLDEGVELCRREAEQWHLSLGLQILGLLFLYQGEDEPSQALGEESLSLARQLNDPWLTAFALRSQGLLAYRRGDDAAASAACEESLALLEGLGDQFMVVYSLVALGHIRQAQSDHAAAAALHRRSLTFSRESGSYRSLALGLAGLAQARAAIGEAKQAARLFGAEERLRESIGVSIPPIYRLGYDRCVALARATLGEETFATAWAEGRAMTLPRAIEFALDEASPV